MDLPSARQFERQELDLFGIGVNLTMILSGKIGEISVYYINYLVIIQTIITLLHIKLVVLILGIFSVLEVVGSWKNYTMGLFSQNNVKIHMDIQFM